MPTIFFGGPLAASLPSHPVVVDLPRRCSKVGFIGRRAL